MSISKNSNSLILIINYPTLLLLSLTSLAHSTSPRPPPFNISHFLYPTSNEVVIRDDFPFLKDVMKQIALKEKWKLDEIRVSNLDIKKAKFGDLQRFEFRVRVGKGEFVFKLLDQVSGWKSFEKLENESGLQDLVSEMSSKKDAAVLDSFKIQGPFHLRVAGDHRLTLFLPTLNNSFPGLKHILVGESITVEVTGAVEVSFVHPTDLRKTVNGSAFSNLERNDFGYWPLLCMAWLPIRVVGSATVVAYRTRNPEAHIETVFSSDQTVKLLPEKCYDSRIYQKWNRGLPINFLSPRIALLERVLQTFLGRKTNQNISLGSVKVEIMASSIFRFQLELEREIDSNDTYWNTLAEWRTKPTVERVWFEVVGRLEEEDLKPITIKKIKPFFQVDSKAWSSLTSNVSFTKFPSILVPQESLTLDVKW